MKSKKIASLLLAATTTAALLAAPAQATEIPPVQVASSKGNTLEAGERSGLIIGPIGEEYEVTSSSPEIVATEQVMIFWVAVAKAPGTAEITVTNQAGETGRLTLTVGSTEPAPASGEILDLNANLEVRQEMVRLINEVRSENGLAELTIDESLMNAAQDVSSQCVTEHRPYDHKALIRYGWPHAGMFNLTMFSTYGCPDIARQAITYWIASPGHYRTMLLAEGTHVGTGVTFAHGRAYCYMVVGDPTGHNPYEGYEE